MPDVQHSSTVTIHFKRYSVAAFDQLTLGEWIDIDALLANPGTTLLSDILSIVCRPVGERYDHHKCAQRARLFRKQSCQKMLPVLSFFFAQKAIIQHDFEPLFGGGGSNQPISSGYKMFCGKWGWYKTIADLSDGNILLFDEVTAKRVVEVFGFLLFRADKLHAEDDQRQFLQQIKRR